MLSPSAAPSLFCPTNKTSSAIPSNKHYLSSPPPTQLTGQVHPAARLGKQRAYQRHKNPSDVLLWNLKARGRQHEGCSFQASIPTSPVLIPAQTHTTALNRSRTGVAGKLSDTQRDYFQPGQCPHPVTVPQHNQLAERRGQHIGRGLLGTTTSGGKASSERWLSGSIAFTDSSRPLHLTGPSPSIPYSFLLVLDSY